jgi:CheY-like chemotaxis protein
VLETDLTSEQREYLSIAAGSAQSLIGIINEILDFSKIEAGRMLIEPEAVDLEGFLDDTVRSMALAAHQKSLEIALVHGASVPSRVRLDPHRVRQVLVNLLGNAVKFTERGGVTLRTQLAAPVSDGRTTIEFAVEDTGIGISPARLAAIFEPFHAGRRLDVAPLRRHRLGPHDFVTTHGVMGGRIAVDSVEGRGSTFRVVVPVDELSDPAGDAAGELAGIRLLVVDDSAAARAAIEALAVRLGAVVSVAASGAEALQALHTARGDGAFDVMLVDFQMPQRNGLDLLHDAHRRGIALPAVLAVTSSELATVAVHPHARYAPVHVHKPVRRQDLVQAIRTARTASPDPVPQVRRRAAAGDTAPQGAPIRVLLVEDNAVNQMVAEALLERRGFEVVVAGNGPRGGRDLSARAVRPRADGHPDARDGRLRGARRDSRPRRAHRPADAGRGPHGARHERGSRAVPRRGDGRLPVETDRRVAALRDHPRRSRGTAHARVNSRVRSSASTSAASTCSMVPVPPHA